MTDEEMLPPALRRSLEALPREQASRAGLEDDVVARLRAAGELGPAARPGRNGRRWLWTIAAVAAAVAAIVLWPRRVPNERAAGAAYLLLLYEDSTYQAPPPDGMGARVAEYTRWADSLRAAHRLDSAAELEPGPSEVTGFFIIRAPSRAEAERIAAACPHVRYGGKVELRKLID
jgi:hypothetical protein